MADFETTTDPLDCRVWLWGTCDINDTDRIETGTDIASFIRSIAGTDSNIFFHNLAFDGSFIIDFLFREGFLHVQGQSPRRGEFATLISNMGKFYSITVRWRNGKVTEFRDSLKKLPMSVKNVAKAFKLKDAKGELDYTLERPVGWVPTDEELEYLRKDLVIVAEALRIQIDEGMTRLTVGADSLAEFKSMMGKKSFDRMFPVLSETMDAEIRRAYRGGFTYVTERYKGRVLGEGRVYDVNSLYPSVMYNSLLPYGEPMYVDGLPEISDDRPLFIASITFTAKLKINHVPCIQIKGSSQFVGTEYLQEIDEPTTLMVTNVDLALWQDHYDMDILSYNGGWSFHGIHGVFDEFIDKWMDVKARSDGGLRVIAKLHLNSLYGKFATNPDVTPKVPEFVDNVVHLTTGDPETRNPVYTAMGVFITAYARDITIRAAQANYDTFVYADTDSLHLLVKSDPDTLDIHPHNLGTWKREYIFSMARFERAKCYTELTNHGYVTHIAGLPDTSADMVLFKDYDEGRELPKLMPRRYPGGIVLMPSTFNINKKA